MNRILLLFILFFGCQIAIGQTTIYSEDFTGQNGKGAVGSTPSYDTSGIAWTIDISSATLSATTDWFRVQSERMEARDIDGNSIWYSPSVNITGYTGVQFSLDAAEQGTMEAADIFQTHYRINGGAWTLAATNGSLNDDFTSAAVSQTGLSGTSIELRVTMNNNAGSEYHRLDNVLIEGTASSPTITVSSPTVSGLDYSFGAGPSIGQSYEVSGTNLTPAADDITVTAPANFSISTTLGGTYSSSLTFPYTGGALAATDVFVRLDAGLAVGSYGPSNVSNAGGGATTENVAVSGTVAAACVAPTNQATSLVFSSITATSIDVAFTAASPVADNYLVVRHTASSLSSGPVDGTPYSVSSSLGGGTVVFNGAGTSFSDAGLTASTTYYYFVFAYNNVACSGGPAYLSPALSDNETTISGPCQSDDFNSGYGNWSGGSGTYQNTTAGVTGNGTGFNTNNDDIITGAALTNPSSITFTARASGTTSNYSIRVQYATTASGPWTDASVIVADGSNTGDITTVSSPFNLALGLTGNYFLRIVQTPRSGGSFYLDDVDVFCGPAGPEIEIQGNTVEIVSGDVTPDLADDTDFGATAVAGGTVIKTFTILNTGAADLTVTGVTSSNAAVFAVAGIATPATILAGDSTTFTVTFDPAVVGTSNATITVNNDDSDEGTYTFDITGEGTNSNSSDIIESAGFTYTSDIDYTAFQAAGPLTNATGNVGVFRFEVRDGGGVADADALGTELTAITFDLGTTHAAYIRSAALFDGLAMRDNSPTINVGAGTIAFSGLSGANFTAADDGSLTLTLRVSFLTNVVDNEQLQFTISSATADASNSVFAAADAGGAVSSIVGDRNRLEVTASQLVFGVQPSNTPNNSAMSPAVEVEAQDANGNVDLDYTTNISITSTGTLTGSPVSVAAVSGTASYTTLTHTAVGTGLVLTASDGSLSVNSSTFDITTFVLAAGDMRPLIDFTDFSFNGDWEFYDGTSWITGGVYDGNAPQNTANTINRILIHKMDITGGGNTANTYDCDIIVQSGGTLILQDDDAPPVAAEFLTAGHVLEVENGGALHIEGDIDLASTAELIVRDGGYMLIDQASMTNDHPVWDGIELFEGNSQVEITDWDWAASPTQRSLINISTAITDNANGYKFGNLYFNPTALTDNWTIVGGPINVNVTEGLMEVNNTSAFYVLTMSNKTAGISATFGDDVLVSDGDFTFGGSFSTDNFDQTINVLGDVIINNDDDFYLHHAFSGTPTIAAGDGRINVSGNLEVWDLTLNASSDVSTKELVFTSDKNHTIEIAPDCLNFPIIIESGDSAILKNEDLKFTGNCSIEIEAGATFNFGFDNLGTTALEVQDVSGSTNRFLQRSGSYLYITHPQGIWDASPNGNVESFSASNTTFAQTNSTFHYIGIANQTTGDAFTAGSTSKKVICELSINTNTLTVSETTGTSDELEIISGIVVNDDASYIYGSGDLTITDGGLRTNVLTGTSTVPALTGTYALTGGFVELNATGDQTLRGARDYFDLIISGSNITGTDDKTPTSGFTVDNKLTVTGTPIFDISNNGMTGDAGIEMDGGLLRISKLNDATPELLGINSPYNITAGTIEWYGSGSAEFQNIRGTYGATTTTVSYHNIEVNSAAANVDDFNVGLQAGIEITGVANINSPAVFQMDPSDHIDGTGTFNVLAGSTYKYGDEFGITLGTSTALSAGALRMSTARVAANFSTDASYGFVGNGDMVSGDALPSEMVNMYVDKTTAGDKVSLSNDAEVKNILDFVSQGIIKTDANLLFVSNDATTAIVDGNTAGADKYVEGRLQWTTDGASLYTFPIGHTDEDAQGFTIDVTGTAGSEILGFLETNATPPIQSYAYCDMETPNGGTGEIGTGTGTPDGVLDQIEFNIESPLQWNITNPAGGISSYDLVVLANGGQDISPITSTNGDDIRYLMKNGQPGDPTVTTTNGAPAFNATGFDACPNQYTLNGLTTFSRFTLDGATQASTTLPVELLFFTAKAMDNHSVLCSWATATEINNDFFTVERSLDGENFEVVGKVEGAGNSSGKRDYDLIDDEALNGTSYYRLKQTDFDGTFTYSNTEVVRLDDNGVYTVEAYPNPFENTLHIVANSNEEMDVLVFDLSGKLVFSDILNQATTLDFSRLSGGTYFLKITSKSFNSYQKIIKQ